MKIILLAKAIKCYILGTVLLDEQGVPRGGLAVGELKHSTISNYLGLPNLLQFYLYHPKIKVKFSSSTLHAQLGTAFHICSF